MKTKRELITELINLLNYNKDVCQSLKIINICNNITTVRYAHRFQHREDKEKNFRQVIKKHFGHFKCNYVSSGTCFVEEITFSFARCTSAEIKVLIDFYADISKAEIDKANLEAKKIDEFRRMARLKHNQPIDKQIKILADKADEINNKYNYCHYMHEIAKLQKKRI